MFFLYNIEECFALPINIYKRVRSVRNQHICMNTENNNSAASESFASKAASTAFSAVDTIAGASCGLLSMLGNLCFKALKATTYFIIGGALILGSVIALSPKPTGAERERLENLVIVDQREIAKKDSKIQKLESEGTMQRFVRKVRNKPLE